jgi:transcriptional accessory protein Tex/SPT6
VSKTAGLEPRFVATIASEVSCRPQQVQAASELFAEGATVPFVARYRKEATGGLEDLQLETLFKRREYFLELTERLSDRLETAQWARQIQGRAPPLVSPRLRAPSELRFDRL